MISALKILAVAALWYGILNRALYRNFIMKKFGYAKHRN